MQLAAEKEARRLAELRVNELERRAQAEQTRARDEVRAMEEAHRQAEARRRASEEAAVEQAARSVAGVEMKLGHAKAQAEAAARELEAEREAARKKEAEAEAARRRAEAEAESARRVSESMRAEVEAKVAAEKVSLDQRITEALAIAAEEWQRAQAEQKRETDRLAQLAALLRPAGGGNLPRQSRARLARLRDGYPRGAADARSAWRLLARLGRDRGPGRGDQGRAPQDIRR